jgi:hypothetical protein
MASSAYGYTGAGTATARRRRRFCWQRYRTLPSGYYQSDIFAGVRRGISGCAVRRSPLPLSHPTTPRRKRGPLISPAVPSDRAHDEAGCCDQGRQRLGQREDVQHRAAFAVRGTGVNEWRTRSRDALCVIRWRKRSHPLRRYLDILRQCARCTVVWTACGDGVGWRCGAFDRAAWLVVVCVAGRSLIWSFSATSVPAIRAEWVCSREQYLAAWQAPSSCEGRSPPTHSQPGRSSSTRHPRE